MSAFASALPRHVIVPRCDYLHRGDALERIHFQHIEPGATIARTDLIKSLGGVTDPNRHLVEVIRGYGDRRRRNLDLADFSAAVARSRCFRTYFHNLDCRGFSFALKAGFSFITPLRTTINLRVALVPENDLFYPQRIRRYLRRKRSHHFSHRGLPPIAFLLGIATDSAWFVFVLQSDLAAATPSYVRDHFRGWRRILFAGLTSLAAGRVEAIFLPLASDVAAACSEPEPPDTWTAIYDQTAAFFQMRDVDLQIPVNIQTLSRRSPYTTSRFHRFQVPHRVNTPFSALFVV